MFLWIILTLMVALAVSGLAISLVQGGVGNRASATASSILGAQLRDIDAQVAAGEVSAADAEPLRNEIRRRVLAEAPESSTEVRRLRGTTLPYLAVGIAGVVALAATCLYAMLGRPELAAGNTPAPQTQETSARDPHAGGDVSAMIAQLEAKMRANPNDPEGWRLLGWSYLATGRAKEAVAAYHRAVTLAPHNADYRSSEGEALVRAADGRVTPSALEAFRSAVKDDPGDPRSKYYMALYKDQMGDHDAAMADWIALIRGAPPDAPWLADVRRFVEDTARERGLNIATKLPPEAAAPAPRSEPSAADIAAASQMSAAQRDTMIDAMVDRLAGELKANSHNEEGWERLMRARMVLGQTAAATVAYQDSINAFAGAPDAQARLRASARALGVPGS